MRTLYVSDLDGTLLHMDETTSPYTNEIINALTEKGLLFSYATARSFVTAKKVTKGICGRLPAIVYNGTFVIDTVTGEILLANYFDEQVYRVLEDLFANNIYPIVYAYIDGVEKFSYIPEKCTQGMTQFLNTRKGDIRTNAVDTLEELKTGELFYITCIDSPEKLKPMYEKYKTLFHVVYAKDTYSDEQWLELMPKSASKANAVKQLKEYLKCDKVVAFGDGKNDMDLFDFADECYAVGNAVEELKKKATGVILSNQEDGVAQWLATHVL